MAAVVSSFTLEAGISIFERRGCRVCARRYCLNLDAPANESSAELTVLLQTSIAARNCAGQRKLESNSIEKILLK